MSDPDLSKVIHRRKQREFAIGLARRLESGMDPNTAAIEAVRENYSSITRPMSALRRAKKLLSDKPWINQGLELLFAHAGLTPKKAAKMHVRHILGGLTEEVVKADGKIVKRKLPPSLKALNSYWSLTVPKPAQRVKLGGRIGLDLSSSFLEPPTIDVTPLMELTTINAVMPKDKEKG